MARLLRVVVLVVSLAADAAADPTRRRLWYGYGDDGPGPNPYVDDDATDRICVDTDRRGVDSAGNDCAWYAGDDNWQWCSDYDTASFDAFASCCGCGGGVERIYVCYTDDTDDGAGRRLTASDDATSPPTASPTYAATAVLGDDATSPPTVSSTYAPTALLGSGATSPPTVSSSYVPTHGPTLNTWDLTLGGTYSGSCTNTNGDAMDEDGDPCGYTITWPSACGCCDDDDFTSNDMCCGCGGGSTAGGGGTPELWRLTITEVKDARLR